MPRLSCQVSLFFFFSSLLLFPRPDLSSSPNELFSFSVSPAAHFARNSGRKNGMGLLWNVWVIISHTQSYLFCLTGLLDYCCCKMNTEFFKCCMKKSHTQTRAWSWIVCNYSSCLSLSHIPCKMIRLQIKTILYNSAEDELRTQREEAAHTSVLPDGSRTEL